MDELSTEDALAIAQLESQPQRPSRGVKPTGFYKPKNPLRPPKVTSRSNMVPKDKVPKDKGKRKRAETPPSGDEGDEGGQGEQGGGSGLSGNGNGNGEVGGDGDGEGRDNGKESSNGKSDTKAKAKPGRKAKPKNEEPQERTPPSECAARPVKKDRDLKIIDEGPKMEDDDAPRYYAKVSRVIEIRDEQGKNGYDKVIEENYRMPNHPPILLPEVDMSLLRTPDCVHVLPDRELVRFAMDPKVLPLLKHWAYMWLNPDNASKQFRKDMRRTFPMEGDTGKPWKVGIQLVAEHAARDIGFTFLLAPLLFRMSRFAQRLVNANGAFFDTFSAYSQAIDEPHKFAARLLLIVWEDVEANQNGFFRTLFKGELSRPNRPEMREVYEAWYIVDERLFR